MFLNAGSNLVAAATVDPAAAGAGGGLLMFGQIAMLGLMFVVMYFILIRPQRKKQKEETNMRKSLQIGDEVTTAGGIVGIIVKKTEDTVVIETGSDRSKIRVKLWAIQSCETIHDSEG